MKALRNCWYVAAHAAELGERPLARTILNVPLAIFRSRRGEPAALHDRCPHRALPLSMGRVREDRIQCAYHGAEFDLKGECLSPLGPGLDPKRCRVRSYPVMEKHGFIWIWMGDPAKLSDESSLPDFLQIVSHPQALVSDGGYVSMGASYLLMVDNLLDATHAKYVHPTTLGYEGMDHIRDQSKQHFAVEVLPRGIEFTVQVSGDFAGKCFHDAIAVAQGLQSFDGPIDWTLVSRWQLPSFHVFHTRTRVPGSSDDEALEQYTIHAMTPESTTSCHYFVKQVEIQRPQRPSLNDYWTRATFQAFAEDKIIVEAQQKSLGERDLLSSPGWYMFPSDSLSKIAREMLDRLIVQEASGASASAPAATARQIVSEERPRAD